MTFDPAETIPTRYFTRPCVDVCVTTAVQPEILVFLAPTLVTFLRLVTRAASWLLLHLEIIDLSLSITLLAGSAFFVVSWISSRPKKFLPLSWMRKLLALLDLAGSVVLFPDPPPV